MPPQPIAPRGRASAWTAAACLAVAGVATIAFGWNELNCTAPVGSDAQRVTEAVCEVLTGIGGLALLLGLLLLASAVTIVLRIRRRPLSATGGDGWRWMLGALFTFAAIVIVTRFPSLTCPAGAELSDPFPLCIAPGDRFDATSWVWLKWIAVAVAPVIGFGLISRRNATAFAIPITVVVWCVGIGWLLIDTIGREYI
jgi:hypothetical protein